MEVHRAGKSLLVIVACVFALALAAGATQSWRINRRLPSINLFAAGSKTWIKELLDKRDYDRALEQLRMQVRLQPYDEATREELGALLNQQGRPEEARIEFEELTRLKPDYAEAYYYVASTYLDTNQPVAAAQWLREAIRIKPEFPAALNSLGVALARQGKLPEAEVCFAKSVELDPSNSETRNNLATTRKHLQEMKDRLSPQR